jgi:two-component system cell cycle sensor histidine kinase/response regulator CckA
MPRDAYVLLEVRDTGEGMDEATLARALEPFFSTRGTRHGHGRGMGLPSVYGIVKQSGGFIWLDSALGAGTTVRIYLPRVGVDVARPVSRTPAPTSSGERATILVVEDEELVRILARRTLERSGYQVFDAPNADAALTLVRQHGVQPDLLLSDIVMPGMDGRTLAGVLTHELPGLPVILMSGYFDQRAIGPGAEAWGFLPKPFTLAELRAAVRDAVALERTTL